MVLEPRGLTEPFNVAEKLATLVPGLVLTMGMGVAVAGGVGGPWANTDGIPETQKSNT